MTYELVRYNTIRNAFRTEIRNSLDNFKPHRKTVILLPGGMGSQLIRSREPFEELSAGSHDFETVWMDIGILFESDGRKLEIDANGRDVDGRIIVPDGPLRFLIKSYDGTELFFTDGKHGDYNYLVFGYDWRRPIDESAGFLEEFLRLFREAVFNRHYTNPLAETTLLCHSQGGLVARAFMDRIANDAANWFAQIVTVGTPFYGTWSQQKRYYEGQEPLSQLHGAAEIARIAGTLPGPYALMFIDKQTFDQDHSKIGLDAYPMVDAADENTPVDPYSQGNLDRYPSWFNRQYLETARQMRRSIAKPFSNAIAQRFFNIRSSRDKQTPTRQAWGTIPSDFDPERDDPPFETISKKGGGDGTVPFWAAWHASTPDANRIELAKAKEHSTLVENEEVLQIVKQIVDTGSVEGAEVGRNRIYGEKVKPAETKDLRKFLDDVNEGKSGREDERAYDEAIWRGFYQEMKR